jgi:hypothetical protein
VREQQQQFTTGNSSDDHSLTDRDTPQRASICNSYVPPLSEAVIFKGEAKPYETI